MKLQIRNKIKDRKLTIQDVVPKYCKRHDSESREKLEIRFKNIVKTQENDEQ